jgi:hypothetical protein
MDPFKGEGMMGKPDGFGDTMELGSGIRAARRFRVLLAHDATAATCDALVSAIERAPKNLDLTDASSVDDARLALQTGIFHIGLVCLDLPPAPLGGVRLAEEILAQGVPVVLVTRSLRWVPHGATRLRELPWLAPDAPPAAVARALSQALSAYDDDEAPLSAPRRAGSSPWIDVPAPMSASAR